MGTMNVTVADELKVDVSKKQLADLRKELHDLKQKLGTTYLLFAERLYEATVSHFEGDPAYKIWGYDSLGKFSEAELGIKKQKAYYLVQIYTELRIKLGIPAERLREIDWGKARELAPLARIGVMTEENAEEWLEKARSLTVTQLVTDARSAKESHETGNPHRKAEVTKRMSFALYPAQYENVQRALETAKAVTESEKSGHQLDMMALEFLSTHDGSMKSNGAVIRYLQTIERLFKGVNLVAIKGKEVLYGREYIED